MQNQQKSVGVGDRFMPCVLGRLTDRNPQAKTEQFLRGVSVRQLKLDVMWNIELILNSRSHRSVEELGNDKELVNSVLGMGLSDFCGAAHSEEKKEEIRKEIIRQLSYFEPRIAPNSLEVHELDESEKGTSILEMEIRGIVVCYPLQEEFLFQARLDLESGSVAVRMVD